MSCAMGLEHEAQTATGWAGSRHLLDLVGASGHRSCNDRSVLACQQLLRTPGLHGSPQEMARCEDPEAIYRALLAQDVHLEIARVRLDALPYRCRRGGLKAE